MSLATLPLEGPLGLDAGAWETLETRIDAGAGARPSRRHPGGGLGVRAGGGSRWTCPPPSSRRGAPTTASSASSSRGWTAARFAAWAPPPLSPRTALVDSRARPRAAATWPGASSATTPLGDRRQPARRRPGVHRRLRLRPGGGQCAGMGRLRAGAAGAARGRPCAARDGGTPDRHAGRRGWARRPPPCSTERRPGCESCSPRPCRCSTRIRSRVRAWPAPRLPRTSRRPCGAPWSGSVRASSTRSCWRARCGCTRREPIDPAPVLDGLRAAFADCYCFCVGGPEGAFVGASPELLVRREGARAQTVALAGTTRRSADPAVDAHLGEQLLQSPKNREEQAIVTRRIRRGLDPVSVWVAAADEPALVKVQNVQHLATPIRAHLAAPAVRRGAGRPPAPHARRGGRARPRGRSP